MAFTLNIDTANAAFDVDQGNEVAGILRELAEMMEHVPHVNGLHGPVRDHNGNTVGHWQLDPRDYRA